MDELKDTSLAKSIEVHEDRPPPPLNKVRNMETGFPKAKKITREIKVKITAPPPKVEDMENEDLADGPNQNDLPFAKQTARFNFLGNEITKMKGDEKTHDAGLHQHGDNPEKPGYALYELAVLLRSQNMSQRAFAFGMVANIARQNLKTIEKDIKELQIPVLAVNALFPPTNLTIKSAAIDLMNQLLLSQLKDPFSIYPYPAIPPNMSMLSDFAPFASDFVEAAKKDDNNICLDYIALILAKKDSVDLTSLNSLPPSIPLFHLSRSAFINLGKVFAKEQALSAIEDVENEELATEAAVVLRFMKEVPQRAVLDKLSPKVLSILLSINENIENYVDYLPKILPLCPYPYSVEFVASCALKNLVSQEECQKIVKSVPFSASFVTLMNFIGSKASLTCPELPTTIQGCWEKRDLVCGVAEYVLQTKDCSVLPKLFPCLYSFTNPAADMITESIFGFPISSERPVDPAEIFEHLATCNVDQIGRILNVGRFFPLHFSLPVLSRKDETETSPIVCEFLDNFADPLPPKSLRPLDLSSYFERFLFDCFDVPSFQKMVYFCVSKGADPEVRQHFWASCAKYLSRICVKNTRKDVVNDIEDDREVLSYIVLALKDSRQVETDILKIAVLHLREFLIQHKGDVSGEVFFEQCRRLPEYWSSQILSFMNK